MKKLGRAFVAAMMSSLIFATTVFATPSVSELRDDKAKAEAKLQKIEKDMTNTMAEINATEKQLVEVGQAVLKANKNLEEAEKQETKQYEAMKRRIVAMYENGNSSMLQMILEADSFGEMLQQAENVNALHTYDRKQLQEYVKTKQKIEKLKKSLDDDMAYIQKKQARLEKDKEELDSMIGNLEKRVDDYAIRIQRAASNATSNKNNNSNNYVPPSGTGGGAAIVAEAYRYLGVPYVWGGQSASGVDCSGLVLMAHKAIGVNLPHYSGSQGSGGVAVSRANAQPGDVVCYSGHVGIYLGGGKMIHAPEPGDVVKVVNVYGSPWFRRYW